jgi:hypothetical protein
LTPFEGDEDDFGPEARQVVGLFEKAGVDEKSYRAQKAKMTAAAKGRH